MNKNLGFINEPSLPRAIFKKAIRDSTLDSSKAAVYYIYLDMPKPNAYFDGRPEPTGKYFYPSSLTDKVKEYTDKGYDVWVPSKWK
jgi:hypothetical protein